MRNMTNGGEDFLWYGSKQELLIVTPRDKLENPIVIVRVVTSLRTPKKLSNYI